MIVQQQITGHIQRISRHAVVPSGEVARSMQSTVARLAETESIGEIWRSHGAFWESRV